MEAAWTSLNGDMNADGEVTLADVGPWLAHVFYLPGDGLLRLVLTYAPGLARFLELGPDDYGGLSTAILSGAVWLFTLVAVGVAYTSFMAFDRALTASIGAWYGEWLRRLRVARRWTVCQLRRLGSSLSGPHPSRSRGDMDLGELVLSGLELDVLRSHALLPPGHVMSVTELAGSLEIRRAQASLLLTKLERLGLLQRSFGTDDGESGYGLSSSGHFVLARTPRGQRR